MRVGIAVFKSSLAKILKKLSENTVKLELERCNSLEA